MRYVNMSSQHHQLLTMFASSRYHGSQPALTHGQRWMVMNNHPRDAERGSFKDAIPPSKYANGVRVPTAP